MILPSFHVILKDRLRIKLCILISSSYIILLSLHLCYDNESNQSSRQKLEAMFKNNTDCGGRPNLDVIVMLKSLFIQQLYSLLLAFMNDDEGADILNSCGLYAPSFHPFLSA